METKNYVIINDPNEIIVNNAYGELKQLYKQNYRTNDFLALKALVKSIENGILDEIDLQPENHQALIDIINGQTYPESTLRSFDIYPEDMMFDTNYTVDFAALHNLLASVLTETENKFTTKHANECVKVSARIDEIITDMFKKNAKNLAREEELKVTIANILSEEQKFDASKYDVNELTKTFTTDKNAVNKIKSKIVGVFKKTDNGSSSGDSYIINVGGYNADQRAINGLAKELNDLYRDLYKKDDYQIAASYASIIADLVNNYSDYTGGDKLTYLQNLVNNVDEVIRDRVANKVNAIAESLDNEYVYTEEDKAAVNAIKEAAQAKLEEVEQHNETVNAEITAKQAEYDAAVAAYAENHNGSEYEGTIITNPGKTIRPSEDKTNELNNIATKHVVKYTVTWNKDNGSLSEVYYVLAGSTLQFIEDPTKEGYTFDGWFVNGEKVEGEVIVNGNMELTAHWTEIVEPEGYYFGAFAESIVENGAFNFDGLELTTEDEFFNEENDEYKYRTVESTYPNFVKYVLIPNEYLNNLTVQDTATHSPFMADHAFTDGEYTLLDYTGWNDGNGIVANFEIKLGGSSVNENTVIETLEPVNPQPQDSVYWYVGFEEPTAVDVNDIKEFATEIGWHNFTEGTTSLHVGEVSNDTKVNWFVLVPADSGLVNVVDAGEVLAGYTNSTITVDNVSYTKITQNTATKKFDYDITT